MSCLLMILQCSTIPKQGTDCKMSATSRGAVMSDEEHVLKCKALAETLKTDASCYKC